MKKFLSTILALIYLSTSMGATVHLHYCMGKLVSWGLISHDSKNCSSCGMSKNSKMQHSMSANDGCCKDEHKQIKNDKDQKAAESAYKLLAPSFNALSVNPANLPDIHIFPAIVEYPTTNAPPDPDRVPAFLRNCNFRI